MAFRHHSRLFLDLVFLLVTLKNVPAGQLHGITGNIGRAPQILEKPCRSGGTDQSPVTRINVDSDSSTPELPGAAFGFGKMYRFPVMPDW